MRSTALAGVISLVIVVSLIGFGFAQQNQSLEEELLRLESELSSSGYSWLVDYTGDIGPKIEVYEKDGNELIALFENLRENEYNKIYLDGSSGAGLGESEQDTFDLRVADGSVEKINSEILQKKRRIDEIKKELKNG